MDHQDKNGKFLGRGTGGLIGPNLVLTAGVNCYSNEALDLRMNF